MELTSSRHGSARLVVAAAALSLIFSSSALAQTGPDLLLGQFAPGKNVVGEAEAIFLNKGRADSTDGDPASVQLQVYNASARFKLDFDDVIPGINRAQPRAGMQATFLDLHADDAGLPDQLTDVSFGVGLGIAKADKWVAGLSVAVGYASADPFDDGNGYYGKADLAFGYNLNDRERIGVVLDYNGNRTFLPDVPLPGFSYSRRVTDQLQVSVGFPFSDVEWKPDEKWTLMFRYLFPDGGEANVDYAITPALHVFAAFAQQTEAFHWDELSDSDDRVLFEQSRAEIGVRGAYEDIASFVVAGGYAFNTQFDVGFDSRDTDELTDLSDEAYVRVGVELKF